MQDPGSPVECDNKCLIEVVSLGVPSSVEEHGDGQSRQDLPIPHQPERHYRVSGKLELPNDKCRQSDHDPDHQGGDDFGCLPYRADSTGESEGKEDEGESSCEEEQAEGIDLPEEVDPEGRLSKGLEWRRNCVEEPSPGRSDLGVDKGVE